MPHAGIALGSSPNASGVIARPSAAQLATSPHAGVGTSTQGIMISSGPALSSSPGREPQPFGSPDTSARAPPPVSADMDALYAKFRALQTQDPRVSLSPPQG